MHAMRPRERNSTVEYSAECWLQELNAYRILLQTLFNYDWVNVPLVYTQVGYLLGRYFPVFTRVMLC